MDSIQKHEELFWSSMAGNNNIYYGADQECVCDYLENINKEFGILDPEKVSFPGVTSPFAYIGSSGSSFTWHVEDMDLYSINFLERGAPKVWYCVPPQVMITKLSVLQILISEFMEGPGIGTAFISIDVRRLLR